MENQNRTGVTDVKKAIEKTSPRTISVFLLVVGGLLVFWAAESILVTAGIWSATDTEYAGDFVLGLLGALVLYYALKK
jgi:predicted metal-binding membrane protein